MVIVQTSSQHLYENNQLHSYSPVSYMEFLSQFTPNCLYTFSDHPFGLIYIVGCKT